MKKIVGSIFSLSLVAGCATAPEEISSSYVSPAMYNDYNCAQISREAQRVSSRASLAMGEQKKKAGNDAAATAVGVILFWPALFFIDGDGGNATEVARLKGELEALEASSIRKDCGIRFEQAAPRA